MKKVYATNIRLDTEIITNSKIYQYKISLEEGGKVGCSLGCSLFKDGQCDFFIYWQEICTYGEYKDEIVKQKLSEKAPKTYHRDGKYKQCTFHMWPKWGFSLMKVP